MPTAHTTAITALGLSLFLRMNLSFVEVHARTQTACLREIAGELAAFLGAERIKP
jgi:hypothetical protein